MKNKKFREEVRMRLARLYLGVIPLFVSNLSMLLNRYYVTFFAKFWVVSFSYFC